MLKEMARARDAGVRLVDLAALTLALPIAHHLYALLMQPAAERLPPLDRYWLPLVVTLLLWVSSTWVYGLYESRTRSLTVEIGAALRTLVLVGAAMASLAFFSKREDASRLITGLYLASAALLLVANRIALRYGTRGAGVGGGRTRYYAVVGSGDLATEIIETIHAHPEWSMKLAGFVLEDGARADLDAVVLGRLGDLGRILEEHVLDEVVFAVPRERLQGIEDAVRLCEEQGVGAMISLDVLRFGYSRMSIGEMDGLPVLALAQTPTDVVALAAKRAFDVVVSALILAVASPVLLAVAVAIKLDSPGPVLFRQRRVGVHGRLFDMLKFRSMYVDAESRLEALKAHNEMSGPVFKMKDDPRVTRIGRFIRRTSLDEFSQFWNVLRGEMSVVGPRPPLPSEVRQYKRWQRRRLSVKPGITCVWQISGRSDIDFDRWMELDLEYIDQWSLWGDVRILLKTIPAVLSSRGAQ